MKHVYYKHKKSEIYISLEELKEMRERGDTVQFSIQKPIILNDPFPINLHALEVELPERYRYKVDDIPFSEDFEVVCIDEEDLNLKDLDNILSILNRYDYCPQGLYSKVRGKFNKLLRLHHEYHTPEIIRKIIE